MSRIPLIPDQSSLHQLCFKCHEHPRHGRGRYPHQCVTCGKASQRAYNESHREQIQANKQRFTERHPDYAREYMREYGKQYEEKNRERRRIQHQEWYQKQLTTYGDDFREKRRAYGRAHYHANRARYQAYDHKYGRENRARRRALHREWHQRNPLHRKVYNAAWRARAAGNPGCFSTDDIRALEQRQNGLCYYCQQPYGKYQIDHRQPLSRGGSNWPENIVLTCEPCNLHKSDKTEAEYWAIRNTQG